MANPVKMRNCRKPIKFTTDYLKVGFFCVRYEENLEAFCILCLQVVVNELNFTSLRNKAKICCW